MVGIQCWLKAYSVDGMYVVLIEGILFWWKAYCVDGGSNNSGHFYSAVSLIIVSTPRFTKLTQMYTYISIVFLTHQNCTHRHTLSLPFCFFAQFYFMPLSAYGFHRTSSNKNSILRSVFQRERERDRETERQRDRETERSRTRKLHFTRTVVQVRSKTRLTTSPC